MRVANAPGATMKGMGRRGALLLVASGSWRPSATAGYVFSTNRTPATRFRTATVDRGTIVATVSATGALAAVTTVQVGSQVSGQIREVLRRLQLPGSQGPADRPASTPTSSRPG